MEGQQGHRATMLIHLILIADQAHFLQKEAERRLIFFQSAHAMDILRGHPTQLLQVGKPIFAFIGAITQGSDITGVGQYQIEQICHPFVAA